MRWFSFGLQIPLHAVDRGRKPFSDFEISANLEQFIFFSQIVPYEGPKPLKLSKNVSGIICRACRGHLGWSVFISKYLIISSLEGFKFPNSANFVAL